MSCPFKPAVDGASNTSSVPAANSLTLNVSQALGIPGRGSKNNSQGSLSSTRGKDASIASASQASLGKSTDDAMNMQDPILNWQMTLNPGIRRIFENLRFDMDKMETNIRKAENEVFRKEEEAFFQRQDEFEINEFIKKHAEELGRVVQQHNSLLEERQMRKRTKALLSQTQKEAKAREVKIRQQELAQRMDNEVKEMLQQHRERFDLLVAHIEMRHERQRKQLIAAQERKRRDQTTLLDLETRGLKKDIREEILKDFQYRLNHQNTLNKVEVDQLLEIQQLELKHRKEHFDAESKALESEAHLKSQNLRKMHTLEYTQKVEHAKEKSFIEEGRETIKVMQLVSMHNAEMKKLKQRHKNALRVCVRSQKSRTALRLKKWKELINAEEEEAAKQAMGTDHQSPTVSRSMSFDSEHESMTSNGSARSIGSGGEYSAQGSATSSMVQIVPDDVLEQREAEMQIQRALLEEQREAEEKLTKIQESLKTLTTKQKEEMNHLKKDQQEAIKHLEETNQLELEELNLQQETEMRALKKAHEVTIMELLATQQREHQMEASIRGTERRTLTERKTLNSVLDNVTDGIITIDTSCMITRINTAVESMFGYVAAELLNQNVKMIVPEPYQSNHDSYVQNYLTTRIAKLIGTGRNVEGMKKDGSYFPIYISVSEVREEEFHLFTAVLRDLTEEVEAEKIAKEEQAKKKLEMEALIKQLDVERTKSKKLIQSILPEAIAVQLLKGDNVPPQTYAACTILFTDICGFTELSSSSDPLDIVDLLNDLYGVFDEIIDLYDVYKVETIGDSYMVASGVPQPNGDKHLSEIAKLALHLQKAISTIKVRHRPDVVLKMRLGIHTGPVVAGVVGRKMPRYCLFGDTVAIASRMESAGLPMKIQLSDVTYEGLEKLGGFHFESRGEMHMQGKGNFKTYFLISKDGFEPVVEPKEMKPISAMSRKDNPAPTSSPPIERD